MTYRGNCFDKLELSSRTQRTSTFSTSGILAKEASWAA